MRTKAMATLAATLMVLTSIAAGCKSYPDVASPHLDPGSLQVTVTSFGSAVDSNGYVLAVGAQDPRRIERFAQVSVTDLPPGEHNVVISDLDERQQCQVAGGNPHTVVVVSGEQAKVGIIVSCGNGGTGCDPLGADCLRSPMSSSGPPLRERE